MMPPTLTAADDLTAAQIQRIYGLGFAAGVKHSLPFEGRDSLTSCVQEISRLRYTRENDLKVISSQSHCIQRLRRNLVATRAAAFVLALIVIALLLVIAEQNSDAPEVIVRPAAEGTGRA